MSMATRSTHAARTSKFARLAAALGSAWESARLADRQVMEIRTDVIRHAV